MSWIDLNALWKTIVYGTIAGAGLPALFAVGLYALSRGPRLQTATAGADGGTVDSDVLIGGSVVGMLVAALCFLAILAAIGWGVYEIYTLGHPTKKK